MKEKETKVTAVEWLVEQISSSRYFYSLMEEIQNRSTIAEPNSILHQALAMEKEQIVEAWIDGEGYDDIAATPIAEQYYNETYSPK